MTSDAPGDGDLVAYIDGELSQEARECVEVAIAMDAQVAARVVALSQTTIGLRKAFDPLLSAAPVARMLESLGEPPFETPPAKLHATRKAGGMGRRWMLAASVAVFALGGLADHLAFAPRPPSVGMVAGHWRDIVASYVRLYTPETLLNLPDDPALRARELATVGGAIGLRLEPESVELADIALKQAQILRYDKTPLAEINYLDPHYGPMTLCIIPSSLPAAAPRSEIRRGLNVSYWNDGHHGFMVIGAQPASNLMAIAKTLTGRFTETLDGQHDKGNDVKL